MALHPGTALGHYEVLSALGAGGMGEVWRARDTRLDREVALKVLPEAFLSDRDRATRFEREAKVLASLDHPNIGVIHGVEEADGVKALVLELVEGPTLADRIAEGPVPLAEALAIARQIVDALDAAHEQGIVHRDLKPANIKVRADGRVKVLDFGLAKALEPPQAMAANVSASPTLALSAAATRMGVVLGTAAYMAPEQARGRPVDKRADIWAFGCVLYEMLVGRRPFEGDEVTDLLVAVLSKEPDWTALQGRAPVRVARLVRRCLEKDPRRRLRDIGDAAVEIEEALAAPAAVGALAGESTPAAALTGRPRRLRLGLALAAAVALGVAGTLGVVTWLRPAPSPEPLARFVLTAPPSELTGRIQGHDLAITRDGRSVFYVAGPSLLPTLRVRRLDQLEGVPLEGAEPGAFSPFLSPDERWVGYFAATGGSAENSLRVVPAHGGSSRTLCKQCVGAGASWGDDDTIVIGSFNGPLRVVSAAGGEPRDVTALADGETAHARPEFLPGGRAVLFTVVSGNDPSRSAIHVLTLETGERKLLLRDATQPRYAASGHLLYAVGSTLWAVAFDAEGLELLGDPAPVLEGVAFGLPGAAKYAVSRGGALAYVAEGELPRNTPVWVDRKGREESIGTPPRQYHSPRLSPDGTRIALAATDGARDIWIWDLLARAAPRRLTFSPRGDFGPVWSPDGRTIFFTSEQENRGFDVFRVQADGAGEATRMTEQRGFLLPTAITPDGAELVAVAGAAPNSPPFQIVRLDASGKSEPRVLLAAEFSVNHPELSPDGRWLAYSSDEFGEDEVFVRPFPAVDTGLWQVSIGGGSRPAWSRDGREIFYLDPTFRLMGAAIEPRGDALVVQQPEVVIERPYPPSFAPRHYDLSMDGTRFLMIRGGEAAAGAFGRIILVQNWFDELRRLAPPGPRSRSAQEESVR